MAWVMNEPELEFEIIASEHDLIGGVSVGVRVHCRLLNISVASTGEKTQYANKLAAIERLNMLLLKQQQSD